MALIGAFSATTPSTAAWLAGATDADTAGLEEAEAEGHSKQSICDKLFLSPKTVEAHVSQIFSKLGLRDTLGYHRRVLAVLAFLRTFDG